MINPNAIGDANLCGSCDEKKTWGKLDPENRVGIRMSRMMKYFGDFNWSIEDHSFLELFTGTGDDEWHLKTSDTLKVTPSISCATLTNDECPGGPRIGDVKRNRPSLRTAYRHILLLNPITFLTPMIFGVITKTQLELARARMAME